MKYCYKCRQDKDVGLFSKDRSRADGLNNCCGECLRKKTSEWKIEHPEQDKINDLKYILGWQERNKQKHSAHIKVHNAVRSGKLVRPKVCSDCDNESRLHGHHEDYNKPLEVIWLCPKCHREKHNATR